MSGIDLRMVRSYALIAGITFAAAGLVGIAGYSFGSRVTPSSDTAQYATAQAQLAASVSEQALNLDAAYIDASQLAYQRDQVEIAAIAKRINQHKSRFEQAHAQLRESVLNVDLRRELCEGAFAAGQRFFEVAQMRIIPAATLNNRDRAVELVQIELANEWRENKRLMILAAARATTSADVAQSAAVASAQNAAAAFGLLTIAMGFSCACASVWIASRAVTRASLPRVAEYEAAEITDDVTTEATAPAAFAADHERALSAMAQLARQSMIPEPAPSAPRENVKAPSKTAPPAAPKR